MVENETVICQICRKEGLPSPEFPDWCVKCADKYGDYTDDQPTKVKIRRRRGERDE